MQRSIHFLFPKPVYIIDSEKTFHSENEVLLNSEYKKSNHGYFNSSVSSNIIEEVPVLAAWIHGQISSYAREMLGISQKLQFTQSWCLKHDAGQIQTVHPHRHPNSIISGAYYVYATENSAQLKITKDSASGNYPYIEWDKDEQIVANSPWMHDWTYFDVKTGRLILFPSNTEHTVVDKMVDNEVRCVLSFNTWFEEQIGTESRYTLL